MPLRYSHCERYEKIAKGGSFISKIALVYKTKYGSTEKYAHWIAEEVKADIFKADSVKIDILLNYDTIVYCGGLYAGGMLGFSLIRKNYGKLKNKKIIVVAVGATLKKEIALEEVKGSNFTPEMQDRVPLFLLRGGLNYKKMNILDKTLMYLLVKSLKFKKKEEFKVVDFTNRNAIVPIINAIMEP